ncbi:MAG: murein L,D-transpeptidase catalytic domain family protein [Chlorobaculum sp.]|nr:murein L,D-transpeptidase catalytic domain family protein [Chlorobaculum sp.]
MNKKGITFALMLCMALPVSGSTLTLDDYPATRRMSSVINSLEQNSEIDPEALQLALQGYYNLKRQGLIRREGLITLIDFDKPSDTKRLYIIDITNGIVLQSSLVAHGKGSGDVMATSFSNQPGSNKSSLGFYLTENTYIGKNGYSLVLKGLDQGINDSAESRSIVIHGANYVSEEYIRQNGRLGRSQGCPALSLNEYQEVIDLIKDGTCLFIYHKGEDYVSRSVVLNPELALGGGKRQNPA